MFKRAADVRIKLVQPFENFCDAVGGERIVFGLFAIFSRRRAALAPGGSNIRPCVNLARAVMAPGFGRTARRNSAGHSASSHLKTAVHVSRGRSPECRWSIAATLVTASTIIAIDVTR